MTINTFLQPLNVLINLKGSGNGKSEHISYWFRNPKANEERELCGENISLIKMVTRFADIIELQMPRNL